MLDKYRSIYKFYTRTFLTYVIDPSITLDDLWLNSLTKSTGRLLLRSVSSGSY